MSELTRDDYIALLRVTEALQSSLDLGLSLPLALPLLEGLVGADHAALAVSRPGTLYDYQWYHVNLPERFLGDYARIADRDFVRLATVANPNRVLVDEEMLTRKQLERHQTYLHARDTADIEQVMAVMLAHEQAWSSGLSLYRTVRRPFTRREAALIQAVVPHLTRAVNHGREHSALRRGGWLEPVVERTGVGVIWLDESGREVASTPRASFLLEHYFRPHERRFGRLPDVLLEQWKRARLASDNGKVDRDWIRPGLLSSLRVSIVPLPEHGMWALALRPQGLDPALEAKLSPRRAKIAAYMLRGLSNQEIADREQRALATIKQQTEEVCRALGVEGRKGLLRLAAGLNDDGLPEP